MSKQYQNFSVSYNCKTVDCVEIIKQLKNLFWKLKLPSLFYIYNFIYQADPDEFTAESRIRYWYMNNIVIV